LGLRSFRFTKNGLPEFFNVRSGKPGQHSINQLPSMCTPPLQ
jgi:hypothetical protein